MHSSMSTYRDDVATFYKSAAASAPNLYMIGYYTTLWLTDEELHKLRLQIDQVDDVVNGPMA